VGNFFKGSTQETTLSFHIPKWLDPLGRKVDQHQKVANMFQQMVKCNHKMHYVLLEMVGLKL
jgi:hypothetical protein